MFGDSSIMANNSTISGNSAGDNGGGVHSSISAIIIESTYPIIQPQIMVVGFTILK